MSNSPDQKPQWVPVGEMFPDGTIGHSLVVEIPTLAERIRPKTTLQQPLNPYLLLSSTDLSTYGDILMLPVGEFDGFDKPQRRTLTRYAEGLLVLPHSRLLAEAFDSSALPAPLGLEPEIVAEVENVIAQMSYKKGVSAFNLLFGLQDGVTRTLREAREEFGVTKERVRQIKAKGFRQFTTYGSRLRQYLVLPEESFGRRVFQAVLAGDLPDLDGEKSVDQLNLSVFAGMEFSKREYPWWLSINGLVMKDLAIHEPFSGKTENEIKKALLERAEEVADRPRRNAERIAREKLQTEAVLLLVQAAKRRQEELKAQEWLEKWGEPRNNFLPGITISGEDLRSFDNLSIYAIGLTLRPANGLKRNGIEKFGELLRLTKEGIKGMRFLGPTLAEQIEDQAALFLQSDGQTRKQWRKL